MNLSRVLRSTRNAFAVANSVLISLPFAFAPHIIGDSTAETVTEEIGHGSAYPGMGFVSSAHVIYGFDAPFLNPLEAAPDDDHPVVGFISIWDGLAEDMTGYIEATEAYPQGVIWVAVPPFSSDSGMVDDSLVALNDRVAEALECEVVPWRWRDVETIDGVHPTEAGAAELLARMTVLAEFAEPCFGPDVLEPASLPIR